MYKVEFLLDTNIPEDIQAECLLTLNTVIDVGGESGFGIVGRIISGRIRAEERHTG